MKDADLLASLTADVNTTARLLDDYSTLSVEHCPGWTVADLVKHHGGVLRWAEAIVSSGEPVFEQFQPPDADRERREWYVEAATRFVATVSGTPRDRPCWTFGRPPAQVWFWTRRQALEAAIHRWDAEAAAGAAAPLGSDLAAAGITEVLEDLFPRQVELGRAAPLSSGVDLVASDLDRRWVLTPPGSQARNSVIEGPASMLLLFLWGRASIDNDVLAFSGPQVMRREFEATRFSP